MAILTLALKALGFALLLFVVLWNVAKLPYFLTSEDQLPATMLSYNATRCENSDEVWCHGMEASVTLVHKIGYRGGKIASHPVVFLAFHVIVGATVLMLGALTIVFPALRRKYGYIYFVSCFILGLHCMPATLLNPGFKLILFWLTSFVEIIFSIIGIMTLFLFDRMKPHSERLLLACWILNTIGAMGAGMAEFFSMINHMVYKSLHGNYGVSDLPAALSGFTCYDNCNCSDFIWFISVLWILLVWILAVVVEILRWQGILQDNFWTCCLYNKARKPYHIYQEVEEEDDDFNGGIAFRIEKDVEMDVLASKVKSQQTDDGGEESKEEATIMTEIEQKISPAQTSIEQQDLLHNIQSITTRRSLSQKDDASIRAYTAELIANKEEEKIFVVKKPQQHVLDQKGEEPMQAPTTPIPPYKFLEVTSDGDIILKVNPESVHMFMYGMFWVMMIFASIVTAIANPGSELAESNAIKVFGYNDICINLDTTPARHLTAMIHPVLEVAMVISIGLLWFRKLRSHQDGRISSTQMSVNNYSSIVLLILTLWVRLVFVVEIDTNLSGHTLAFFGLQFIFTVHIISHFALSVSLSLLPIPLWVGVVHAGFLIGTAIVKLFFMASILTGNPIYLFVEVPMTRGVVHFVDILWLILHSVIPLGFAYLGRKITPPTIVVLPNPMLIWIGQDNIVAEAEENHESKADENKPKARTVRLESTLITDAMFQKINQQGNFQAKERLLVMFERTQCGILIELNSETIRFMVYMLFWAMVLFAIVITKISTSDYDIENSALIETFGFNNICIYWDYSPSRELTAMFYPLVEVPLIMYLCLNFLRKYHALISKQISFLHFQAEAVATPFLFVMVFWFRMIFVAGAFESVPAHTLGFFGLQISLLLVLFSNYGYHSSHRSLAGRRVLALTYLVAAVTVTIIKISLASSVFVGNPLYSVGTTSGNGFAHAIDIMWMILQSLLPAVFSWRNKKRTPASVIHVR